MTDSLVARARAVLETERQALDTALDRAPEQVAAAARLILDREPADVIVTGVGKSGHIAHKLAATFSSVGTRSHFYWTSEMFHGDLGSVQLADQRHIAKHARVPGKVDGHALLRRQYHPTGAGTGHQLVVLSVLFAHDIRAV